MKKILILSAVFFIGLALKSQTVTYPVNMILADSALEDVNTKLMANSQLTVSGNGTTITVTGSSMRLTYDDLVDIMTNGGTITGYQLVIKTPSAFASQSVHANLPDRLTFLGNAFTYEHYFETGIESGGNIYMITVNIKGHALTGSQIANVANQARLLYGGSNSDYILLTTDPEFTALQE